MEFVIVVCVKIYPREKRFQKHTTNNAIRNAPLNASIIVTHCVKELSVPGAKSPNPSVVNVVVL